MFFTKIAAAFVAVPLAVSPLPVAEVAQNDDRFANWVFLYEDVFENRSGQEVTQRWWVSPNTVRENNLLEFTLLARRSPQDENGTAAAVFDYVANCEEMRYAIQEVEFLDADDATLNVQTYQRVMETADTDSEFYAVLDDLCTGVY